MNQPRRDRGGDRRDQGRGRDGAERRRQPDRGQPHRREDRGTDRTARPQRRDRDARPDRGSEQRRYEPPRHDPPRRDGVRDRRDSDRSPRRDSDRGPRRDERDQRGYDRGPRRDSDRGPRRDERDQRGYDRGPRRDSDRGPRRDERDQRGYDRGPRGDDRGSRRDDREPRRFERERDRDDRPRRFTDRPPRDRDRPPQDRDRPAPERDRPPAAPAIPAEIEPGDLDQEVRGELRSLSRPVAETVARHLVAAGRLIDDDPEQALAHALAARRKASRIAAVREAVGLAAYRAGDWQTAIAELRTYHRMSGRRTHLAVLADCERGLGRPARAIDIYRSVQPGELAPAEEIELLIVAAGARADLSQRDAAVAMLQISELDASEPWTARLRYAYADALLAAGRKAEAREWFARAAAADDEVQTDAAERLLDLDGVVLELAETEELDEPEGPATEGPATEEPATEEPEVTAPAAPAGPLVDAYDLVILDLDGVIYLGEEPIPGAIEAVERLRQAGLPVLFATNNASRGAGEVAALLTRLGIEATATEVVTSAAIAADALAERLPPGSAVLVVGSEPLADEVRRVGLEPVADADARPAAVVQGYAPHVGWGQLAEACLAIRAGAQWVVTNTDATLPSPRGELPGNGSLVAVLRTALGRDPDLVVGKPHPEFFTAAAAARAAASRPLVVGDRLDTDIEGAVRAGMDSLLVLTGVSSAAQAHASAPRWRPTYLGADLAALFEPAVTGASGA